MYVRLLIIISILLIAPKADAELIYLRNGKIVRGNIVKITPIYIRLSNITKEGRKEYLTTEILRMEQDKTQDAQISEQALKNIQLQNENKVNRRLKKAAMKKATEIITDTMTDFNIETLENTPESVRIAAMEIANQLVIEALASVNKEQFTNFGPEIKAKSEAQAREILTNIAHTIKQNEESAPIRTKVEHIDPSELIEDESEAEEPGEEYIRRVIHSDKHQDIIELVPVEEQSLEIDDIINEEISEVLPEDGAVLEVNQSP